MFLYSAPLVGKARECIARSVPFFKSRIAGAESYLPRSITLFWDEDVHDEAFDRFLEAAAAALGRELERHRQRQSRFVALGLVTSGEMNSFVTG